MSIMKIELVETERMLFPGLSKSSLDKKAGDLRWEVSPHEDSFAESATARPIGHCAFSHQLGTFLLLSRARPQSPPLTPVGFLTKASMSSHF